MGISYDSHYGKNYHDNNDEDYEKDYHVNFEKEFDEDCEKDYLEDYERDHHEEHRKDHHEEHRKERCETIKGNVFDIEFKKRDCEVRADIIVGREKRCIRLWGQVKDCEGRPVEDALVKLLKPIFKNGKHEFEGVAHTKTDCLGFYQFEVCPEEEKVKFRVIVSKATKVHERKIDREHGICNPCRDRDKD